MHGAIKLRSKKTNNETSDEKRPLSGPLYLSRPKSWGEFQSNFKSFQSVHAPSKISKSPTTTAERGPTNAKGVDIDDVVIRRKTFDFENSRILETRKSGTFRSRPLSEVLLPTPFYRSVRTSCQSNDSDNAGGNNDVFNDKITPQSQPETETESLDVPSLLFEEALDFDGEVNDSPTDAKSKDYLTSDYIPADRQADIGITYTKNKLEPSFVAGNQQPEGSTSSLKVQHSDVAIVNNAHAAVKNHEPISYHVCESKPTEADLDVSLKSKFEVDSSDSAIGASEVCMKDSDEAQSDSDASSVIDTGFYSFGGRTNSQTDGKVKNNSDLENKHDMPDNKTPLAAPRKARSGIPTPLRGCYNNSYEIGKKYKARNPSSSSTSKSYFSSSSMDLSEEESLISETFSLGSNQGRSQSTVATGYDGDRSTTEDINPARTEHDSRIPHPRARPINGYTIKRKGRSLHSSKDSETDSTDSGPNKSIQRDRQVAVKILPSAQSNPPRRNLGWKDDQNAPIGATESKNEETESKDEALRHGTWPRRIQRSKRKQDQEEAEELMRRFRETSETYRAKFRNIYAESRRKMEETIFGLRVAMAKNGYSVRCYKSHDITSHATQQSR